MTGGVVVVLGHTGRNFAAAMSGGIAYVLDEQGDFERRVNLGMIELEPIEAEDLALERTEYQGGDLETRGLVDALRDLTRFDALRLQRLLERHHQYTGSRRALHLLTHWAARCMDCGIPFCHQGCPIHNLIPDWNDLVYKGNWREALEVLHSTNNFPGC